MNRTYRSFFAGLTAAVIALTVSAGAMAQQPSAADSAAPPPAATAPAGNQTPVPVAAATIPAATGTPLHLRSSGGSASEMPSSTGSLWKLGAISAIIAAAAWYLRKKRGALGASAAPPKTIQVLSRASVGVRTELVVVEVDGMTLLLGVTPSAVSRLAVLGADATAPAKEEAAETNETDEAAAEESKEAMVGVERFAKLLDGIKKSAPAPRLVVKGEPMPVEPQARGLLALRKR